MKKGSAFAIGSVCCGAAASLLLAWAHGAGMMASWAGMGFAFAVEATGDLDQAREVGRVAWRTMESAVELIPMLWGGAVALYMASAVCAAVAAWRYRPSHGSWIWLDLAGLILVIFNVYVAMLMSFVPPLQRVGFATAIATAAVSGFSLRRHENRAESGAMAAATLTVALLTIAAPLAAHLP